MEYQIVKSLTFAESHHAINNLQEKVNLLIKNGWEPKGGVCIVVDKNDFYFAAQAMVKMR